MNRRIWLLVVVHAIAWIGFSVWVALKWPVALKGTFVLLVATFALIFCESGLLGFWTAMSRASALKRATGLVAGLIALEAALHWGTGFNWFASMPTMATGFVVVLLALLRMRRLEFLTVADLPREFSRQTLQFSIRGLMLLTLIVAVLITVGKQLRQTEHYRSHPVLLAAWALAFAATDIAAVWAALSPRRLLLPGIAVLILSTALGFLVCWGLGGSDGDWIYVPTIMLLQTAMLLASLLVVRSSGYRMVRRRTAEQAPSDADSDQETVT